MSEGEILVMGGRQLGQAQAVAPGRWPVVATASPDVAVVRAEVEDPPYEEILVVPGGVVVAGPVHRGHAAPTPA